MKIIESLKTRGLKETNYAVFSYLKGLICSILGIRYLIKNVNGSKMIIDLKDKGISRTLLLFGTREKEHLYFLKNTLKENSTLLELGANIGYYALYENKVLKGNLKLICVEPVKSNFDLLKSNLALNGIKNVYLENNAVSDIEGEVEFVTNECSNMGSIKGDLNPIGGKEIIKVKTKSIINYINKFEPDLIRMDIEGHEVNILNAISEKISILKKLPSILFETHNSRYKNNNSPNKSLQILNDNGYKIKYAATSNPKETNKLIKQGLKPEKIISTDGTKRGIYRDLPFSILLNSFDRGRGFRTVLLTKD